MTDNVLPPATQPEALPETDRNLEIVQTLRGYKTEADNNRKSGLNPRDQKWKENLDLYWNRPDFSQKAEWQAHETMPEVPNYVDRFAAALKEALLAGGPENFYTVVDPYDAEGDIAGGIKRMMDVWLTEAGTSATGQCLTFPAVFEEQVKMGALMACCGVVNWRKDKPYGRVSFDAVDPRNVWLDHTGRNLYRVRQIPLDLYDLQKMAGATDKKGLPIYNQGELMTMVAEQAIEMQKNAEELTGGGQEVISTRRPITLDEYRATVIGRDGRVIQEDGIFLVGNDKFLLRGPETNPYWHNKDWLVFAPLITTPLSVYGRTYMEDFGAIASTFTELTNLILDAIHSSAINANVMVPSMLLHPEQAAAGIKPGTTYLLDEGFDLKEFAAKIEMGSLDDGAVTVWQAMKKELSEAAGINEIGLGQFAPNSRTSATEISETQQSSSALIRSIAQTLETRLIEVVLDLFWKTGLQHADPKDKRLSAACGDSLYTVMMGRRKEFIKHPTTFQARGISTLIQKSTQLNRLLSIMQVIAQSQPLLAAFLQVVDINKLLALIFNLSNIDITKLEPSARQRMVAGVVEPMYAATGGAAPSETGMASMTQAAGAMGVGK